MLTGKFRPWGESLWVLQKLKPINWDLLGCISTEQRCVSVFELLKNNNLLNKSFCFEIIDPFPTVEHEKNITANRARMTALDNSLIDSISKRDLLQEDYQIYEDIQNVLANCSPNLIIDISCFPKRFFFPFVKLALKDNRLSNLLITYTKPEKYSEDDLSDDPEPWYPLPLFMPTEFPDEKFEIAIVGTGFMPFSLPKLLKDKHSEIHLKLFFPFPPGPPNYQRSWEFIRKIEKHYTLKEDDKILKINSLNLSEAFDHICSVTNFGTYKAIFAPYGPKPISLAMCIYASLSDSPVYYTQPKYYNPNYSIGSKESYTYCIKIDGINLFSINP